MTVWAVFKDFRGVAYCEPVNEALAVYVKRIPARPEKRNWLGKIKQPAREADTRLHIKFDENVYSRDQYMASAFEDAPSDYEFDPNKVYMVENRWGPVDVILFLYSDDVGRRMQYEFRRLAPEGELYDLGSKRDNSAKPHENTDRIIEQLRQVV